MTLFSPKRVVAASGIAVSLTAGSAVASAAPDTSALVNTTCSYEQIQSALNAERPDLAPELAGSIVAQSILQQFLAAPQPQREQMAEDLLANPVVQDDMGAIMQVASICNRY